MPDDFRAWVARAAATVPRPPRATSSGASAGRATGRRSGVIGERLERTRARLVGGPVARAAAPTRHPTSCSTTCGASRSRCAATAPIAIAAGEVQDLVLAGRDVRLPPRLARGAPARRRPHRRVGALSRRRRFRRAGRPVGRDAGRGARHAARPARDRARPSAARPPIATSSASPARPADVARRCWSWPGPPFRMRRPAELARRRAAARDAATSSRAPTRSWTRSWPMPAYRSHLEARGTGRR